MTEKELFEKNLEINHEFSKFIIKHPDLEEKIPTNALIVFIVENDTELSQKNLEMSRANREPNQPLVFLKIKAIRPEESRLVEPRLEFAA